MSSLKKLLGKATPVVKTMLDPLDLGLGDAIFGNEKGPDYSGYDAEQARLLQERIKAGEDFAAGGAPVYEQGEALQYEELSPEQLAKLKGTAFDDISTDPRLRDAELDALNSLIERSNEGLTLQDEADMARLQSDVNRRSRGRMGAIDQQMKARGVSGSGMDMMAQMQANQDAVEMEALALSLIHI